MYNQYFNPYVTGGLPLLSRVRSINWGNFLNNTQRTLNVINQAIPIVNQVKPMVNNAKTMLRVMREVNKPDEISNNNVANNNQSITQIKKEVYNKPQFLFKRIKMDSFLFFITFFNISNIW